jgi:hypothetical protein
LVSAHDGDVKVWLPERASLRSQWRDRLGVAARQGNPPMFLTAPSLPIIAHRVTPR